MSQIQTRYFLQNNGSNNMAVDGSVNPVTFDLSHVTLRTFKITLVTIYIEGPANFISYNDFWNVPGPLANGLAMNVSSQLATYMFPPINDTRDLFELADRSTFIDRTINPARSSFRCGLEMYDGSLVLGKDDTFTALVQDDLSDLDYLSVSVKGIALN